MRQAYWLAAGAIIPTIMVALCMMLFPDNGIDEMFAVEKEKGYTPPAVEIPAQTTPEPSTHP